jgi:hypothetical protein
MAFRRLPYRKWRFRRHKSLASLAFELYGIVEN